MLTNTGEMVFIKSGSMPEPLKVKLSSAAK